MKAYHPYSPEQSYVLRFMLGLLGELDLGAIERAVQAKDARGEPTVAEPGGRGDWRCRRIRKARTDCELV